MKLWLVKDRKGRIFGPYNEQEICFYIEEKEFKGEELISSYPVGKWKPLSSQPVFYEKILTVFQKKDRPTNKPDLSADFTGMSESEDQGSSKEPLEPTRILTSTTSTSTPKDKKVRIKLSREFKEDILDEGGDSQFIEMANVRQSFLKRLISSLKLPLLILAVVLLASFFILSGPFKGKKSVGFEDQVHLLSVSQKRRAWSKEEIQTKLRNALSFYYKDTISNYLLAQKQYVQILEGNPDESPIYYYLCLVYLEVWPFTYQNSKDRTAFNTTLNLASKKDKGGIYSGLCRSVQSLINKNPEQSLMITNSTLNVIDGQFSPIFFYYVKARALKDLNRTDESRKYLRYIYKLRPEWIAPYMLDAEIFYEQKQYALAGKLYQNILSVDPNHLPSVLRLGILEYKHFKKVKNSEIRLKSALANINDLIHPEILTEAYIVLASIYFEKNNQKAFIDFLNKAYALDPEHPDVILLKSKLGSENVFEGTQLMARGLIYRGDILVGQGKCSEAIKYFKRAYSSSHKRNALAALRMAECYWQSGASGQAIRWLKRSISADTKMLSAYFHLADYLSALYDFESARDVLSAVKNQAPSNYDLFKAYALLSFRQKQYQAAIVYAERSLKFYTFDEEIYVLLSKSYLALGKGHKSFAYAEKAVGENINSVPAQIAYALSLDLAYGPYKAEEYFQKLIKRFPLIVEYTQAFGEYYFDKGMYEKALDQFQKITEQTPDFKSAYIYLGRIYNYLSYKEGGNNKKYQQALKYFLEASLLDVSDPEPLFYVGQTHMDHKQYQLAENEFEKILRINSNYPLVHYYIGLVNYYQEGDENLEKALKFARTQSAKSPNNYLPYKLAGDIYKLKSKGVFDEPQGKQVNYKLCIKEYQHALKYLKNDIEVSIGLIECYKGAGDLDSAEQLAVQLTKREGLSGYSAIYRELGSIFESRDQYEKARAFYNSYFSLNPGAKDRKEIENRINRLIQDKQSISEPKGE